MQTPSAPESALTMKDLSLHALSAHVVAWHNRHPLARRITAAQVQSVGYVVLPFVAEPATSGSAPVVVQPPAAAAVDTPGGTSLRERAMARAQGGEAPPGLTPAAAPPVPPSPVAQPPSTPSEAALTPAFSEDFIAPLRPSQVARWAAVHGVALAVPRTDAPVRQVMAQGAVDAARLRPLWVLTAQVETGTTGTGARTRVLVGAGDTPSVLGRRLWSRPRIAGLLLLVVALLGAAVFLRFAGPPPADTQSAAPQTSASAPVPAALPASASQAARPADVEPALGRVTLPAIGPRADESHKATEQPVEPSASAPAAAATAAATAGPAFAISTRLLRTRTESEQVAAAMRALLVGAATPKMQVEVMPVGDDWRVVGWPYADRALAEKARALLAGRGLKVEVIDF